MIHLYENCNCTKITGFNDICLDCATRSAVDFKRAVSTKTEPSKLPASYRDIWREIVHGDRKWRVTGKYNPACGHPGVRDTQGKCIFCKNEKKQSELASTPVEQYVSNLRQAAKILRERARVIDAEITAIELFEQVPTRIQSKSPRQFALEQGDKWYQSDEPCKHCGALSERYVANGRCRSCGK